MMFLLLELSGELRSHKPFLLVTVRVDPLAAGAGVGVGATGVVSAAGGVVPVVVGVTAG